RGGGGAEVTTVYMYKGGDDNVLYVGVTGRNIQRAREHSETQDWWPLVASGSFEHYSSPGEAKRRETMLIQALRPPFNKSENRNPRPVDELSDARVLGLADAGL